MLSRVVLALDAVILESLVAICIGFAKGCCQCCELGAADRSLGILEKHDSNEVGRGIPMRQMRKFKMCPSPLVGILTKHLHPQWELPEANSHHKPMYSAGHKRHDVRFGRQLNTIHYAIFVRKKLRSTFNQAWICLLHLPLPQTASQNSPLIGLRNEEFIYARCFIYFGRPAWAGSSRLCSIIQTRLEHSEAAPIAHKLQHIGAVSLAFDIDMLSGWAWILELWHTPLSIY